VHFWGEQPEGVWKVHIDQNVNQNEKLKPNPLFQDNLNTTGTKSIIKSLSLVLYGTKETKAPRQYEALPQPPEPESTFSANETNVEAVIRETRSAIVSRKIDPKHLDAIDRLIKTINKREKRPRRFTRIYHHVNEK
jgi:cell pole-organizing protein PopZ